MKKCLKILLKKFCIPLTFEAYLSEDGDCFEAYSNYDFRLE